MALHFSEQELGQRRDRVCEELQQRGLHALLCFRQETDFYLTGYDTFGYCFFQCLVVCADGRVALLTRAPDLRQAQHTSVVEDVRVWTDEDGSNPSRDLVEMLDEFGCRGKTLGIEFDAYGLNASLWRRLESEISGFCSLEDASDLVTAHRVVKSESEIEYVRRAAELADDAYEAALPLIQPGAWEGDILGAMHNAIFSGGGDYPGNEFIIGAGQDALLCRYFSGRKHIEAQDQLTLEWAGSYRHYHSGMMRTVIVGNPDPEHLRTHQVVKDGLEGCEQSLRPGVAIGEVFDSYARIADAGGFKQHRLNGCGYSLGATFTPTWMDWPMLYHANPVVAEPNMVFFMMMILANSENQHAMTLGHTVRVTENGCERLSRLLLDLVVIN
jgi:Xaa-Pro dipeptidase